MRSAVGVAVFLVLMGCLPEKSPIGPDAAPPDADPSTPDAVPPPDAPPLEEEGVSMLAGSENYGAEDGPRNVATFNNPVNVAVHPDGSIYVADFDNDLIRRVSPDGYVTTIVEQPLFQRPFGLAITANGTVYVQTDDNDAGEHSVETGTVWRIDSITHVASPIARNLGRPRGMAVLGDGRLVLADMWHHTITVLDPLTGQVEFLAGKRDEWGNTTGVGAAARFNRPYDPVVVGDQIFVSDFDNHCIRRVTLDGAVSTFAGTCSSGFKDGPANEARFNNPQGMALGPDGTIYVTDIMNFRIRAISPSGIVTTFAGDGTPGFRDGDRLQAQFFGLEGQDVGPDGTYLYVADGSRGEPEPHHRIRRIRLGAPSLLLKH